MKAKEIIKILEENGYSVGKKKSFYNGSGYRERYEMLESHTVKSQSYLKFIIEIKANGFICQKGVLNNFYSHNGKYFDTFTDINEFLKVLNERIIK